MTKKIFLSDAERLIIQVIRENPSVFADGIVDWNHVRDYAIQACAEHNLAQGRKSPVQHACVANGVNRTYYYKANIAKKRFI